MLIYIAGKIAGLDRDDWVSRFATAAMKLKTEGHIPINPAVLGPGWPPEAYMPVCLAMLNNADAIYLLENWEDSPGAKLEKHFAEYQGLRVMYQESHETDRDQVERVYLQAAEEGYRKFVDVSKKVPCGELHFSPAGTTEVTEDGIVLRWSTDGGGAK